jgi:metabotropic X receptor
MCKKKSFLDFDEYFNNLIPSKNTRNPWFVEYWEETYKCKFQHTPITIFNQNYTRLCSGLFMIN